MPKARLVVGDQNSAEFDQLRTSFNNLLTILENAKASVTAGVTAENIFTAIADGIAAGIDSNPAAIANYVSSDLEIVGELATPQRPPRPGQKLGTQLTDY